MFLNAVIILAVVVLLASLGAAAFTAQRNRKALRDLDPLAERLAASQRAEERKGIIQAITPLAYNTRARQALQAAQIGDSDNEVRAAASKALAEAPTSDPAAPLLSILPKWLVCVLAVVAFALVLLLLFIGLYNAELLEKPMPRFVFACAIAFAFAVFFFVFYPQKVAILPPGLDSVSRLVGPLALFFIVAKFLLLGMPSGFSGRLFHARENGFPVQEVNYETVRVNPKGEDFVFYVVPDGRRNLVGIYVEFPVGAKQFKAQIKAPSRELPELAFTRDGPDSFEFGIAEKK
jgi:hypothetical protein